MNKGSLEEKFALIHEHWQPKFVAELNGQEVKLVKFAGVFPWHHHDCEDEFFLVWRGQMAIEFRDRRVTLQSGEFCVVQRGVEHRTMADTEAEVLVFEPADTRNTGNIVDQPFTAPNGADYDRATQVTDELDAAPAREDDIPTLEALIPLSVRALQASYYSQVQMEAALGPVFAVDRHLIRDGTYFAVEPDGQIVGCGGWSKRRSLYGGDQGRGVQDAELDPARVRAFFVHPACARIIL